MAGQPGEALAARPADGAEVLPRHAKLPARAGLHRFCVRAARAPEVELTLRSLALGVTAPPPQYLHDEVSLYRERALACTRPKLRKLAAGDGPTVDRLLVFQHADANNYYHFFAQSLPRLLLLLDDELVAAVPEVADAKIFASVARPFATATFEALGISDRIVEYDPCTTVHADEVLAVVEVVRRRIMSTSLTPRSRSPTARSTRGPSTGRRPPPTPAARAPSSAASRRRRGRCRRSAAASSTASAAR